MVKEVHVSKYAVASYNEQEGIYIAKYLPETENMRDHEWKMLMTELLDVNERIKPKYVIDDNTHRYYSYPPDIQAWTVERFIDCWNRNGLKKYIQIEPNHIIGQITTVQIIELAFEEYAPAFKIYHVKTIDEALFILKENN